MLKDIQTAGLNEERKGGHSKERAQNQSASFSHIKTIMIVSFSHSKTI